MVAGVESPSIDIGKGDSSLEARSLRALPRGRSPLSTSERQGFLCACGASTARGLTSCRHRRPSAGAFGPFIPPAQLWLDAYLPQQELAARQLEADLVRRRPPPPMRVCEPSILCSPAAGKTNKM